MRLLGERELRMIGNLQRQIDLRMPGGSGWDVIDYLREHSPETVCVISTGHGDRDDAIRAIRMGAYDFLPKPVSLFEIGNVLDRIGEKKALENKNIALENRLQRVEGRSDHDRTTIGGTARDAIAQCVGKRDGLARRHGRDVPAPIHLVADRIDRLLGFLAGLGNVGTSS